MLAAVCSRGVVVRGGLLAAAIGFLSLMSAPIVSAAGWSTSKIAESDAFSIGCMDPGLCVVAGYVGGVFHGKAALVLIRHGRPRRPTVMRHTLAAPDSVSCPSAGGCVAVVPNVDDLAVELVTIRSSGRYRTRVFRSAHEATFDLIACASLRDCVLAGAVHGSKRLAVAFYNGRSLRIRTLPSPVRGQVSGASGIACSGAACMIIGNAGVNPEGFSEGLGWFAMVQDGRVKDEHQLPRSDGVPNETYAVACATSELCFVTTHSTDGYTYPIIDGTVASPIQNNVVLNGLACWSTTCMGVGAAYAYGIFVPFSLETPPSYQQDFSAGVFFADAVSQNGFVAALGTTPDTSQGVIGAQYTVTMN
jgi:hypothetical protein